MNSIFIVLPILTILMFDLGLTLEGKDFRLVLGRWRAVLAGMTGQLVILPLLAWLVARALNLDPIFTIGLVLIACCPGGSSSNVFSMLAGGDVALSVSLTAVSSLVTLITVPLIMQWTTSAVGSAIGITLPVGSLLIQNLVTMLLPILLGIGVRHWWPHAAARIERVLSKLAFPALMLLAGVFFVQHRATIATHFLSLGSAVTLLLLAAVAAASGLCYAFRLRTASRRTIIIEVGMQNAAQAIAIASSPFVFGDGRFAIPAILYALMMNVVLLTYVGVLRARKPKDGATKGTTLKAMATLAMLGLGVSATAQEGHTTVGGEAHVSGGFYDTTPWGADVQLDVATPRLTLRPYVGVAGISHQSSGLVDDLAYRYSRTGDAYRSHTTSESRGTQWRYGTGLRFGCGRRDTLTADVQGTWRGVTAAAHRDEKLTAADASWQQVLRSVIETPEDESHHLNAQACYQHFTTRPGERVALTYGYTLEGQWQDCRQSVTPLTAWSGHTQYQLTTATTTQRHQVALDWRRPLSRHHALELGTRYEDVVIRSHDRQWVDLSATLDDRFHHRTRTVAASAGYRLSMGPVVAQARVEYDYTRQQQRTLHDVVPQVRVQWSPTQRQQLVALYGRRIIRPTAELLNPAHIVGPYTIAYGNADLEGIHADQWQLSHSVQLRAARLATTLTHLKVEDGFNAIWMEKEGVRISFWGNEGVRRMWSLAHEEHWTLCPATRLHGRVAVAWDKRIARAISMQKEHWGIDAELRAEQKLAWDIQLEALCRYAEGATQDLYSHATRSITAGGDLRRAFLASRKLTATLSYRYEEAPRLLVTQGAYTGHIYHRADTRHALTLVLAWRF